MSCVGNHTIALSVAALGGNSLGGSGMLDKKTTYRGHAAECLALAETTTDPNQKATLVEMAISWFKLPERADAVSEILGQPCPEKSNSDRACNLARTWTH